MMKHPCNKGPAGVPCGRVRVVDGVLADFDHSKDCILCYAYSTDENVNRKWGGTGAPHRRESIKRPPARPVDAPPPEPCVHSGGSVPPAERVRLQIGHLKMWQYCDHPKKPLGRIVCPCAGCGPACSGYKAEPSDADTEDDQPRPASPPPTPVAAALHESRSDKRSHGYTPLYEEVTRGRPIRSILEIGVLAGDSIRAWARAWPDAEIVAADVDPAAAERIRDVPQARFVRIDVADTSALIRFGEANRNRFDLLIDDSTHKASHQVAIRRHLYQAIRPGGVMVIEDVPNDAAAKALRGRVWDFRAAGRWDSRAVTIERPKRPRVLFSGNYLKRDGAPILLANLARHLRGWDVTLHSPHDGPLREVLEEAGVPVVVGELPHRTVAEADLIVANTILAHGVVRRARDFRLPCVWLIHESDPAMAGAEVERQVREVIGYPARVVFPCRATADVYRGFPEHRAEVIPTVIPPVPLRDHSRQPANGHLRIVTFGRDEPRKGQQDIRDAIAGLADVSLVAAHDRPDALSVLSVAGLYVCSSRVEAFPLSIQEAKAYGLPVITTPVFGCAEVIRDGIDGLHYRPGDVEDLRAKIERIRTDTELRVRLSRPLTHLPSYDETLRRYEVLFAGAAGVAT